MKKYTGYLIDRVKPYAEGDPEGFLDEYIRSSELDTRPSDIVTRIADYLKLFHDWVPEEVREVCEYIVEHPETHSKLREVTDCSYRTSLIQLTGYVIRLHGDFSNIGAMEIIFVCIDPEFSPSSDACHME